METTALHVLIELHDCDVDILNDVEAVDCIMCIAITAAGATIIKSIFHRFSPYGVTGLYLLAESHCSFHSWPERAYAAVDFYTCGQCTPERAVSGLVSGLNAKRVDVMTVNRGLNCQPSLQVLRTKSCKVPP